MCIRDSLRGEPIILSDWQVFLFANILGFKRKDTGLRKYRSAYVQVARKNAKSTVAAVLANWFLVMEGGQQDIYTAAVSRDQARIVFDDARLSLIHISVLNISLKSYDYNYDEEQAAWISSVLQFDINYDE